MKSVLVALEWNFRSLVDGIIDYAATRNWFMDLNSVYSSQLINNVRKPDGVITFSPTKVGDSMAKKVESLKVPTVYIDDFRENSCSIQRDWMQIPKLAYEHLRSQGFRNFYTCGDKDVYVSTLFSQLVNGDGLDCSNILLDPASWREKGLAIFNDRLKQLNTPCAVFCYNDSDAQIFIDAATVAGFKVPEEIAVIGCNNETLICEHTIPAITSVDVDFYQIGHQAAKLLAEIMNGKFPTDTKVVVKPKGVVQRQSSNYYAVTNPEVRKVILTMQNSYQETLTIDGLAKASTLSKRALERLFKKELGKGPGEILRDIRMREAGRILRQTDEKVGYVAYLTGYGTQACFTTAFKKHYGMSPITYRRQFQ